MPTEIYRSLSGKARPACAEAKIVSQQMRTWFLDLESTLRERYPSLMAGVRLTIVGSVAANQACPSSDINILVRPHSSDELVEPQVRNAIHKLLKEMREAGEQVYPVDVMTIKENGHPMFSALAMHKQRLQHQL